MRFFITWAVSALWAAGQSPTIEADKLLLQPIYSVMDKAQAGPSSDKHDFVSYAPYWWPDPAKPDGLPYIRKDGHTNKEMVDKGDAGNFSATVRAIHILTEAFVATNEPKYAGNAVRRINKWFVNPATRMNPNLEYGQAIMGRTTGRGAGLISMRGLIEITAAVKDLKKKKVWVEADDKPLREWFSAYLKWLESSEIGLAEKQAKNNHGSWYAAQAMAIELYLGRKQQAKNRAQALRERIAWQIEPDGRQPLETSREDGFSYSVFNLEALAVAANMAEPLGVNLWKFKTPDGRCMRVAFEYLEPFAAGSKPWPYKQLKNISPNALAKIRQIRDR